MSTLTLEGLTAVLSGLGADAIPPIPGNPPAAQPLTRPTDIYRIYLAHIIANLTGCSLPLAYDSLQNPTSPANGDLVLPVPRLRLKSKNPTSQCTDLASSFPDNHPLFKKPSPTGIHLPIFFTTPSLPHLLLPYIFHRGPSYGSSSKPLPSQQQPPQKKVLIEFSSPNIAKEFHAGHLRSTILGAFLANLFSTVGNHTVTKINYLGDWGKQFGLLAIGWQRFGSEDELARDPLKHLLEVYARINREFQPEQEASRRVRDAGGDTAEIEARGLYAERNAFFKRMEDGEGEAMGLWRRFRGISVERYVETYGRLNIGFDEYAGESQVKRETVEGVERVLREKGVYEEDDGSWLINFEKYGFKGLGVTVVRGRTGTTTYLLRDVAAVLDREEKYGFDKMIYVVSTEQDLYFRRVFRTLELMGRADLAARLQHVNFGKVLGMSSRLGNVQLLSDILDQSGDAMHDVMRRNTAKYAQVEDPEAVAEAVGISAVMVQDMSGKRINNYPFDITRMTSFEGDTGPYLQYCHARLNSILRKAGLSRAELVSYLDSHPAALIDDLATKQHCVDLLRLMAQYPDVTATALQNLEPSTVLTYLFRLAHQVSSCYSVVQVVDTSGSRDVMLARAALYEGARQVLENGMRLLGLSPVKR